MNTSLQVVKMLQDHLMEIRNQPFFSERAAFALEKDARYLEKCAYVLSAKQTDAINNLWSEVQYLSRFFGQGYAEGKDQQFLQKLMDDFEAALLEEIVVLRSNPSEPYPSRDDQD